MGETSEIFSASRMSTTGIREIMLSRDTPRSERELWLAGLASNSQRQHRTELFVVARTRTRKDSPNPKICSVRLEFRLRRDVDRKAHSSMVRYDSDTVIQVAHRRTIQTILSHRRVTPKLLIFHQFNACTLTGFLPCDTTAYKRSSPSDHLPLMLSTRNDAPSRTKGRIFRALWRAHRKCLTKTVTTASQHINFKMLIIMSAFFRCSVFF